MFRKHGASNGGRESALHEQQKMINDLFTMIMARCAYVQPTRFDKTLILAIITDYVKTPRSMNKDISGKYNDIIELLIKAGIFSR